MQKKITLTLAVMWNRNNPICQSLIAICAML